MTTTLLLITIGPVQEFIAAGRTTRDLWFGSELLSQVGRQLARSLRNAGATLIFPAPASVANDAPSLASEAVSVPNRVLAEVAAGDIAAVVRAARAAAQAVLDHYRQDLERRYPDPTVLDQELMRRQVDGFLEFYAAWTPYDADVPGDYQRRRAEVERLLNGRKALRDFVPAAGLDGQPKSALDPSRESVIRPGATAAQRASLQLKGREELDALSLIKRLTDRERFPSLSRVAIDPFIRRLGPGPELAALAAQARSLTPDVVSEFLPGNRWRHYAAFPFNTTLFSDEGRIDDRAQRQRPEAVRAARRFFDMADRLRGEHGIGGFPDYLAILVADGDRMGELMSVMTSREEHQRLSAGLATFAAEAEAIVRHHHGAMIYAGGDDALAFLPLDRALDCADRLQRVFATTVSAAAGRPATLSVGVAIVHAAEHMQHALTWAREAEGAAKQHRNSLAVAFHPRSGGGYGLIAAHPWDKDPVGARWRRWIALIEAGALSMGALYELRHLSRELRGLSIADQTTVLGSEASRILRRKQQRDGTPVAAATVDELLAAVEGTAGGLDAVVNELLIARRIAAVVAVAGSAPAEREAVSA